MNTIKFSHKYEKLEIINYHSKIQLLEIFIKDKKEFSPEFLSYDTSYFDENDKIVKNYHLRDGKHIVLLFIDNSGNLFTTVRPFTEEKFSYYDRNRGKEFQILFVEN